MPLFDPTLAFVSKGSSNGCLGLSAVTLLPPLKPHCVGFTNVAAIKGLVPDLNRPSLDRPVPFGEGSAA